MPDFKTLREGIALCQKVTTTLEKESAKQGEAEQKKRTAAIKAAADAGLDVDMNALPSIGSVMAVAQYDLIGRLLADIQAHVAVIEELTG